MWSPKNCVVIGASGGIGSAFVQNLLEQESVERVFAGSTKTDYVHPDSRVRPCRVDYRQPTTIETMASALAAESLPLDLVIVATGQLHDGADLQPEKSLRQLDGDQLSTSYLINAVGPMLVAKHLLPLLAKDQKAVFAALSARVGSISDNRIGGWYGYRAAKAGLNQMLRTASIEQARRWPHSVVIGLHPGTVDTDLSKPFQRNVAPEKLFTADASSSAMLQVIDGLTAADTGKVFAYDGSEVPA